MPDHACVRAGRHGVFPGVIVIEPGECRGDVGSDARRRDGAIRVLSGFEGEDTFYHTTQLKSVRKVGGIDLVIFGQHDGGAEISESGVDTESLFAKVRCYIITAFPSFELASWITPSSTILAGPVAHPPV